METLMKEMHPTKRHLIEVVSAHLDGNENADPCSDEILQDSGVSKGSMYHHFKDFPELIEITRIYRFSRYVNHTVDALSEILGSDGTKEEVKGRFFSKVKERQPLDHKGGRAEYVHLLSRYIHHRQLDQILAKQQELLTQRWAELYAECVKRGFAKSDLDPRAVSVFMQASLLGRIVDDVSTVQMKSENWVYLLHHLLDTTFFGAHLVAEVSAS